MIRKRVIHGCDIVAGLESGANKYTHESLNSEYKAKVST